jgi:hypothetical protein
MVPRTRGPGFPGPRNRIGVGRELRTVPREDHYPLATVIVGRVLRLLQPVFHRVPAYNRYVLEFRHELSYPRLHPSVGLRSGKERPAVGVEIS